MGLSLKQLVKSWPVERQEEWLASLSPELLAEVTRDEWWFASRPEQIPPEGPWSVHIALAGRGWGKTRSGAEWIVDRTLTYPLDESGFPTERLVVSPTLSDARDQCIEGPSGVIRVLERKGIDFHYTRSPKPRIEIRDTEAKIHFVGSDPDKARGFNLADVWGDEIIKWMDPSATWRQGILPALRAKIPGDHPRAFITSTPKPIELLFRWVDKHDEEQEKLRRGEPVKITISLSTGSTFDNADNLSDIALQGFVEEYQGTELGQQELEGKLLRNAGGKLFRLQDINGNRVDIGPVNVISRVVGVDPSLTEDAEDGSDEMGVVVMSRDSHNHMYVIADESKELTGHEAALHIWRTFALYEADVVVYENNLGKAWMKKVLEDTYYGLRDAGLFPEHSTPPLKAVHSNQGKVTRAEPVALRYQQGRVHHIGEFPKLEMQQVTYDPLSSKDSPDRMDALVHAARWLMEGEKKEVKIATPARRQMRRDRPSVEYGHYGVGIVPGA